MGFQLNIDTLVKASSNNEDIVDPGQELSDKIHFLINNLSSQNMHDKMHDLETILYSSSPQDLIPWFSHYMVVRRASIEPNFHSLYLEVIAYLNDKNLYELTILKTIENVRVLLSGEKI